MTIIAASPGAFLADRVSIGPLPPTQAPYPRPMHIILFWRPIQ